MISKKIALFFMIVLLVGFVGALTVTKTVITVQAGRYDNITVSVVDPEDGEKILKVHSANANEDGVLTFDYSALVGEFNLIVDVKTYEGDDVGVESFGPFTSGDPVNVSIGNSDSVDGGVGDSDSDALVDQVDSVDSVAPEESDSDTSLTGLVVSDGKDEGSVDSKIIYYVLGGLLIVGALVLLVRRTRRKIAGTMPPHELKKVDTSIVKGKKDDDGSEEDKDNKEGKNDGLKDAEKRIVELQKEIGKLKNRGKIEELEKHIENERNQIKRWEEGEE